MSLIPELKVELDDDERAYLKKILEERVEKGVSHTSDELLKSVYHYEPVDIIEFIESEKYLNMRGRVFPRIIEALWYIDRGDVREAYAELGKGSGKSVIGSIMLCRFAYKMAALRDPQSFYQLLPGTTIYAVTVSISLDQARAGLFTEYKGILDNANCFRNTAAPSDGALEVRFPNRIVTMCGHSMNTKFLGLALHTAIQDECGDLGTLVWTARGLVYLGDVKEGSKAVSMESTGTKVLKYLPKGTRNTKLIKLSSGRELIFTPEHTFLRFEEETLSETKVSSLQVGDKLPVLLKGCFGEENRLGTEDISSFRKITPPNQATPSLLEVLGYYYGDGTGGYILITDKEKELVSLYTSFIEESLGFTPSIISRPWRKETALGFMVKETKQFFDGLGIFSVGTRAKDLIFPIRITKFSRDVVAAFLRGFYTAEGHCGKDGTVNMNLSSRRFLLDMQVVLGGFGINSHIWLNEKPGTKKVIKGVKCISSGSWKITIIGKRSHRIFWDEIGFSVGHKTARKREFRNEKTSFTMLSSLFKKSKVYLQDAGLYKPHYYRNILGDIVTRHRNVTYDRLEKLFAIPGIEGFKGYEFLQSLYNNNVIEDEIISIEDHGDVEVADLSLEEPNIFTANSVLVHNCNLMKRTKTSQANYGETLYGDLQGSLKTRFNDDYKLVAVSSANSENDFLTKTIDQVITRTPQKEIIAFDFNSPKTSIDMDDEQLDEKVIIGGEKSYIDYYNETVTSLWKTRSELIIRAPSWEVSEKVIFNNFKTAYRTNPSKAHKDFGNVVSRALESYFKEKNLCKKFANPDRLDPYVGEMFADWFRGDRRFQYAMHFDVSNRHDNTGWSLSHLDRYRGDIVVLDWVHSQKIPEGSDMDYSMMKNIISHLIQNGFNIQIITTDGFQSFQFRQDLTKMGINTELLSVDRNLGPYDTYQELLLTGRLDFYYHEVMNKETNDLVLIEGNKVDHDPKDPHSSKDLTDAVAGCCYTLLGGIKNRATHLQPMPKATTGGIVNGNTYRPGHHVGGIGFNPEIGPSSANHKGNGEYVGKSSRDTEIPGWGKGTPNRMPKALKG